MPDAPQEDRSQKQKDAETHDSDKGTKPTKKIIIPLISTPSDQENLEEEMEELFNEDKVTHQHGGTEPERD